MDENPRPLLDELWKKQTISKPIKKICYAINTHFLIDFILRHCKEDKSTAYIYARISIDGICNEIPLRENIHVSDWDPKRQMVQGTGIQVIVSPLPKRKG